MRLLNSSPLVLLLCGIFHSSQGQSSFEHDVILSRHLNNNNNNQFQYDYNVAFAYDLSAYSVVFEHCQDVKMYDDDLAADEDATSPLARRHFVVFRLCPSDTCETECTTNFGRYATDVETFLTSTVNYQKTIFENMCNNCQEECDEDGNYCSGCGSYCYQYQNMENMGYVDASNFIECQAVPEQEQNDDANNNNAEAGDDQQEQVQLYIGPSCSSSGTIHIGLFTDENCLEPEENTKIEDVLGGAQLSYTMLTHSLSKKTHICLSCAENNGGNDQQNQNDANDADNVNEMCEDLYASAAKCESKTGIANGFIQMAKEDNEFENQVETEFLSCGFIDQLIFNSYTERGEINLKVSPYIITRVTTRKQIVSLSLLSVTIAGLVYLIYYFNKKIKEVEPDSLVDTPTNLGSYAEKRNHKVGINK